MKKAVGKVFNIIGNVIFLSIIIISLIVVGIVIKNRVQGTIPDLAGNKIYIILSDSMSPQFKTGSIVDIKKIEPEQIAEGDIITFKHPKDNNTFITHRVIDIKNENHDLKFVTKGDVNDVKDTDLVPAKNVIGKMKFSVPYIGYVLQFIKDTNIIILILIVVGLMVTVNQVGNLFSMLKNYCIKKIRKTEDLEI